MKTPAGERLTLMNPAYMVRQLMEDYEELYGVRGRITSTKPLRPENGPDEWELAALKSFERGETEAREFTEIDGEPYLRLMRPMMATESCLKCHAHQGYKAGDVRGGVGVSVPAAATFAATRSENTQHSLGLALIWMLGLAGTAFGTCHVRERVHEREVAEKALRESEERYRGVAEDTPLLICRFLPSGKVLYANQAYCRHLGRTNEELVGQPFLSMIPKADREAVMADISALTMDSPSESHELQVTAPDGERRWQRWTNRALFDANGRTVAYQSTGEDITDRKRREHAMAAQLRLSEFATSHSVDELLRVFLDETEALTESEIGFYHFVKKDQVTIELQAWSTNTVEKLCTATGKGSHYSINKAGVWMDCVREGCPVIHNDVASLPHRKGLPEGHAPVVRELVVPVYRGGRIVAIFGVGNKKTDYVDEDVKIVSDMANMAWEIVGRKRAEEEQLALERQVLHAQKLESLGVLAGGIAHDFNNILAAVLGYADLAVEDLGEAHPVVDSLHEIISGANRAAELTRQMLAYSGKGKFVIENLDVSALMDDMAHLLRTSVPRSISLHLHLERSLPPIQGDVAQMQQVVMNLITNAADAIGDENGAITLSTGHIECDEEYLGRNLADQALGAQSPPPGTYVCFQVSDTGCGMDEETRTKLFEPFFTTKFTGRGLGMAAVLGIVRGHKGAIMLDTEPGRGSTFRVLLPAVENPSPVTPQVKRSQPGVQALPRGGTILVIDDEEAVRNLTAKMLERQGFTVLTATDGEEGVEVFRKNVDTILSVFVDLTMPRMSGKTCIEALRQIRDDVTVIIMSGYTEQAASAYFPDRSPAGFIKKPFRQVALNEKMDEILCEKHSTKRNN
jgi:PAS domain S-box-containing protein